MASFTQLDPADSSNPRPLTPLVPRSSSRKRSTSLESLNLHSVIPQDSREDLSKCPPLTKHCEGKGVEKTYQRGVIQLYPDHDPLPSADTFEEAQIKVHALCQSLHNAASEEYSYFRIGREIDQLLLHIEKIGEIVKQYSAKWALDVKECLTKIRSSEAYVELSAIVSELNHLIENSEVSNEVVMNKFLESRSNLTKKPREQELYLEALLQRAINEFNLLNYNHTAYKYAKALKDELPHIMTHIKLIGYREVFLRYMKGAKLLEKTLDLRPGNTNNSKILFSTSAIRYVFMIFEMKLYEYHLDRQSLFQKNFEDLNSILQMFVDSGSPTPKFKISSEGDAFDTLSRKGILKYKLGMQSDTKDTVVYILHKITEGKNCHYSQILISEILTLMDKTTWVATLLNTHPDLLEYKLSLQDNQKTTKEKKKLDDRPHSYKISQRSSEEHIKIRGRTSSRGRTHKSQKNSIEPKPIDNKSNLKKNSQHKPKKLSLKYQELYSHSESIPTSSDESIYTTSSSISPRTSPRETLNYDVMNQDLLSHLLCPQSDSTQKNIILLSSCYIKHDKKDFASAKLIDLFRGRFSLASPYIRKQILVCTEKMLSIPNSNLNYNVQEWQAFSYQVKLLMSDAKLKTQIFTSDIERIEELLNKHRLDPLLPAPLMKHTSFQDVIEMAASGKLAYDRDIEHAAINKFLFDQDELKEKVILQANNKALSDGILEKIVESINIKTLYHFKRIDPSDWIVTATNQSSTEVNVLANFSDQLAYYIQESLFIKQDLSTVKHLLEFYIDLMEHLLKSHNYFAAQTICNAINKNYIEKFFIKEKEQSACIELHTLLLNRYKWAKDLFSPKANYAELRKKMKQHNCIPSLIVTLHDVILCIEKFPLLKEQRLNAPSVNTLGDFLIPIIELQSRLEYKIPAEILIFDFDTPLRLCIQKEEYQDEGGKFDFDKLDDICRDRAKKLL